MMQYESAGILRLIEGNYFLKLMEYMQVVLVLYVKCVSYSIYSK